MSIYIDTSILLSAAGLGQEASDQACRHIVSAIGSGRLDGVISCETLQELLHTADWRQVRAKGLELTDLASHLFPHVRPVSATTLQLACDHLRKNPRLGVRIALHVAAMQEAGVSDVISDDLDYGLVSGIRRLSPIDACQRYQLIPSAS
jgi:predicted nucleic acid-binding protein